VSKFRDLSGKKFGRWLTLERDNGRTSEKVMYKCECECGYRATVDAQSLRSGKSTSCGCVRMEQLLGNKFAQKSLISRSMISSLGSQDSNEKVKIEESDESEICPKPSVTPLLIKERIIAAHIPFCGYLEAVQNLLS
jgi:hypothetical protein